MNNEQEQKKKTQKINQGNKDANVKVQIETGEAGVDVAVDGKELVKEGKPFKKDSQETSDSVSSSDRSSEQAVGKDLNEDSKSHGTERKNDDSDQATVKVAVEADQKKKETSNADNEKGKLDQELRRLQQSLLESELKALKLEGEMQRLNEQYTKKVTEKAVEAQKLVDKRLNELQEEFAAKSAEIKKYALTNGAAKLAELLQNFEMVLSTSQKAGEAVKNYSQGFVMVFEMMVKTLEELGIKPIEVKPGDVFDHNTMEIFEGVDTTDYKHNQVVEVLKKGYRLHDKVILHAIVKVAN